MDAGIVPKNEKNYRLLSQAWMLAHGRREGYSGACRQRPGCSMTASSIMRLANAYLNIGEYGECVKSANNAIRKGGLKNPDNSDFTGHVPLQPERQYS